MLNGVTIFLFLCGDIIGFPFFSFIFSSESQVHSHCFLLSVLFSSRLPELAGNPWCLLVTENGGRKVAGWTADWQFYR